ncbi:MAG: T9SS type A sorting domain-containing protein [Ignavibacteriae bacterium]|nr:T9SS type A sorting domain-containing protein [Ignavibacteria bacterium]MBI3365000.1 T9SS type A sorting domain-containing protein [Ignavibacteriota bacterium]
MTRIIFLSAILLVWACPSLHAQSIKKSIPSAQSVKKPGPAVEQIKQPGLGDQFVKKLDANAQADEGESSDAQAETEESVESESADLEAVNTPILFTMTGGAFETAGRILLYSANSDKASTSMLNEDQAQKSGLKVTPAEFALQQNYPNPFNPTTTVQFELPEPAVVTLRIYNTLGQEVKTLLNDESMEDGEQEVNFDASSIASGVYFYRIVAQTVVDEDARTLGQAFTSVKKMVLVK